jgi:predicted metal-dependent hydrolase
MSMTITNKTEFKDRVHRWAEKLDARVTSVSLRPMTKKWASYSTAGRLTFDTFLLRLREDLQDYVIVHELLHFHVPNHGKLWKSLMRTYLGEYEELEAELNEEMKNELEVRITRNKCKIATKDSQGPGKSTRGKC